MVRLVPRYRIDGANTYEWLGGPVVSSGQTDLWDAIAIASASASASGGMLGIPCVPAKQLHGLFEKSFLQPGQSTTVTFLRTRRDLGVWNVEAQKWRLQSGGYGVYVEDFESLIVRSYIMS